MSVLVGGLLVAVGLVLGLLVLAALLPVRLEMHVEKTDEWEYAAKLRPFGRLGPPISLKGRTGRKSDQPDKRRASKRHVASRDQVGLAKAIFRLIVSILAKVRLEEATLDARIGLGDPAETGMLYGRLVPVLACIDPWELPQVSIVPDFDQTVLRGRAALTLSLRPADLIGPGWHFLRVMRRDLQ